jgi:hypothetical protein
METLTRLVSESLARHGFDRPLDYRRLQWSRWFRCESPHSLLSVPSKAGVFALAEEVVEFEPPRADPGTGPESDSSRRMLAVTQFFEHEDMAFVLDRMLSQPNPMRARLNSGRYFVRFVLVEDPSQRHSICAALNQWIAASSEKVTGIGAHFAASSEAEERDAYRKGASNAEAGNRVQTPAYRAVPASLAATTRRELDSGAGAKIQCPSPFPSGF